MKFSTFDGDFINIEHNEDSIILNGKTYYKLKPASLNTQLDIDTFCRDMLTDIALFALKKNITLDDMKDFLMTNYDKIEKTNITREL